MSKDNDFDNVCEGCNREFKNSRGVKIHQGKTKCGKLFSHRSERKSEDVVSTQEKTHSDASIQEERKEKEEVPSPIPTRVFVRTEEISTVERIEKATMNQPSLRDWIHQKTADETNTETDSREKGRQVTPQVITRVFVKTGRRSTVDKKATSSQRSIREWIDRASAKKCEVENSPSDTVETKPGETGVDGQSNAVSEQWKPEAYSLEEKQHTPPQQPIPVEDGVLRISAADISNMKKNILLGRREEVLAQHNLKIERHDLRSLYNQNYLNDTIIDEYFLKIQNRSRITGDLSVAVLTIYFYQRFDRLDFMEAFMQTESWIKEDLRMKDMILIPVHKSSHFTLVHIDTKKRLLSYFDPLKESRYSSAAPGRMKRFIEEYYRRKGEAVTFKVKIRDNIPTQTNGVDCGVFVSHYAERISRNAELRFSQANMQSFRIKMMWEILHGELKQVMLLPSREKMPTQHNNVGRSDKTSETKKNKLLGKEPARRKIRNVEEEVKTRIQWPQMNSTEWEKLDTDLTMMLKDLGGTAEKKAEIHPQVIYKFSMERFGPVEPKKQEGCRGMSRRQKRGKDIRAEITKLKQAYKDAPDEEKEAIGELQNEKVKKLRLLKRAEALKANRHKFKKNSDDFIKQPFVFARKLLTPEVHGKLESTEIEVQEYLKKKHSDERRVEVLKIPGDLYQYPEVVKKFDEAPPTWKDFTVVLRKTRNKSAPGPNGIPYKLYKKCPGVARLMWLYLRALWKKGIVSNSWRRAEGIFIPKEDGAVKVEKFRTISFLNVEPKLSFGVLAKKMINFTLANGYIDTAIQKGGVPGVSGCLEHTTVLSQLIKEARTEKKNLVATWLDIADAYGSTPHQLIAIALRRAHVPEKVVEYIEDYYKEVSIRFTTDNFTTGWQQLEKGIVTGCTLSVVLFSLTMTMLMLSVKSETKGPRSSSGQQQQNTRLFMDDISTTTETSVQTRYLLREMESKLKWGRLEAKPEKCRYLSIWKGEVTTSNLQIGGKQITSIADKPIKYLGKEYNVTLSDKKQIEATISTTKDGLKRIDKSHINGRYKCWIVQHMLLPRIMWPLMIYTIPMSKVEEIQRLITAALKRWLKLPRSMAEDVLYANSLKLQLPYSSLIEEVKKTKARSLVTMQQSKDDCISKADINIDAGRKWKVSQAVENATTRLRHQEIAGIPNVGREGIGMNHRSYYSKASQKEKRSLIVGKVQEEEDERRYLKIASLTKQGVSTKWEVQPRKLSHREVVFTTESKLQFLVKSVYDLLPTPSNKNTWFGTKEYMCPLCGKNGTLNHILSGCKVALQQGRYTWRHDRVLREIAGKVEEKVTEQNKKSGKRKPNFINFVKAGIKEKTAVKETDSYLSTANDWSFQVDLDKQLKIPSYIATTNLRPDMIVISKRSKQLGVMELTVPSEERIEVSAEGKRLKYAELEELSKRRGWRCRVWTVEIGCRGFAAGSLAYLLKSLGYRGRKKKNIIKTVEEVAADASQTIWRCSHFKNWGSSSKE